MKVVTIHESNYRQAAPTLRIIADEIEAGDYGAVGCVAIAVMGEKLDVFGAGPESDASTVHLVFHAAAIKMAGALLTEEVD